MGYIIDALFFRLKFTKSWFYIGFVRKKFYSYLIALQANIFNYLIFIFTRDLNINKQGFYLSSIKLIQKHSYFVLLLLGKISSHSPLLKSFKNKFFIFQGGSKIFKLLDDNFLTHFIMRTRRGHRLLKKPEEYRNISYLFYINKLFDFNSIHLLNAINNSSDLSNLTYQKHFSLDAVPIKQSFWDFILDKQKFKTPNNYTLDSFWLKLLILSKRRYRKRTRRKFLRFLSPYKPVSLSRNSYNKIFQFFKYNFSDYTTKSNSNYYFKRFLSNIRYVSTNINSYSDLLKKFFSKFTIFRKVSLRPTLYKKAFFRKKIFSFLFNPSIKANHYIPYSLKNHYIIPYKLKLFRLLRLKFLKYRFFIRRNIPKSRVMTKTRDHSFNFLFDSLSTLILKTFFSIVSSPTFFRFSLSNKIRFINNRIILKFKSLLLQNINLFTSDRLNHLRLFFIKLTINFINRCIRFSIKSYSSHLLRLIARIVKIFGMIDTWLNDISLNFKKALFPDLLIDNIHDLFEKKLKLKKKLSVKKKLNVKKRLNVKKKLKLKKKLKKK